MPKTRLTQLLMQSEDIVTAFAGQIPVIFVNGDPARHIVMAVNFLRAGCPTVQFVLPDGSYDEDVRRENLERWLSATRHFLKDLSVEDSWSIEIKTGDQVNPLGDVINLRRD